MEYVYSTHLLEYAEAQGACVFNGGAAIRNHPEKLAITEISEFTAPTLVTRNMARLKAFHDKHQDVIVKPLDGMGGTGVFRLQPKDPNLNAILETLTDNGARTIMAQRFIPDIVKGDKRILLIGGEPVPYSLARIPLAGETRGNLAAGGRGVAQELSPGTARSPKPWRPSWPPAACFWLAWMSSATSSPKSTSPAPPVSSKLPSRPVSMWPACSCRRSRKRWRPRLQALPPLQPDFPEPT